MSMDVLQEGWKDGALDPTFGLNGISETNYGYPSSGSLTARVQSDGKSVVSGYTSRDPISSLSAVTARYLGTDVGALNRAANINSSQTAST